MNKLLKNKKNILVIVGIIILILVIVLLLTNLGKSDKPTINSTNSGSSNSAKLEDILKEKAKKYYEENFYTGLDDTSVLAGFTENGINISIKNIDLVTKLDDATKKKLDKKECDYDESKVYIYPEAPFKVNNYKVKVELSCKK